MMVELRNKTTSELKLQKIGWSWTCLFFSCFLGIPLFKRRLYFWGGIGVLFWVFNLLSRHATASEANDIALGLLGLFQIAFAIVLAVYANRLAGRKYLKNAWEFAEPNSIEATTARQSWGLLPS